ncbi:MAG: dTDP-4-dehydrorhamnose 3,5-epimerase family protein [Proteobacteria bacterium]|nr:dTDP-4-dehydrorhamnose 3,5-epimerase family protein [Pseudomonadota bacterium]
MKMHPTPLQGLTIVETAPIRDERGEFVRVFCADECSAMRPNLHWTQVNMSRTFRRGAVRGMHFQRPPAAEAKLIRCVRGRVFDVAVDLREESPTFLRWHGIELSADEPLQYFIPEGFAHGFQALTDDAHMLYLHTVAWDRAHEGGVRHDDPALAIAWPLPVTQVSEKDRDLPLLDAAFAGVRA